MKKKPTEKPPVLPFPERPIKAEKPPEQKPPGFRNFKEAMRHGIYSRPRGKSAEMLALEAGLDRLSDLSRYVSESPDDPRGKFLDIFIPLLIAMEEKGDEMVEYIRIAVRNGREAKQREREEEARVKADLFFAEHGDELMEHIRNLQAKK